MSMAVLTSSTPIIRKTKAVTKSPTPKAMAHTSARMGVGTGPPDRRGATHPSGARAPAPPRAPVSAASTAAPAADQFAPAGGPGAGAAERDDGRPVHPSGTLSVR